MVYIYLLPFCISGESHYQSDTHAFLMNRFFFEFLRNISSFGMLTHIVIGGVYEACSRLSPK